MNNLNNDVAINGVSSSSSASDSGEDRTRLNLISGQIVDAAVKIHSGIGQGLIESVYERVLVHELIRRAVSVAMVHQKQLLTYLRLLDHRLGLVLNFGAPLMKNGIHRIVNKL